MVPSQQQGCQYVTRNSRAMIECLLSCPVFPVSSGSGHLARVATGYARAAACRERAGGVVGCYTRPPGASRGEHAKPGDEGNFS